MKTPFLLSFFIYIEELPPQFLDKGTDAGPLQSTPTSSCLSLSKKGKRKETPRRKKNTEKTTQKKTQKKITKQNNKTIVICFFLFVWLFFCLCSLFLFYCFFLLLREMQQGLRISCCGPHFAVLSEADRIRTTRDNDRESLAACGGKPSLTKALNVPLPIKVWRPTCSL